MYFNHAFRKSFLGITNGGVLSVRTTGTTADLTAGQVGLFDAKTFAALGTGGTGKPFILAQGSYFTNDKIGPVHGGYKESVKSKVINPKYISRVFTTCAVEPATQVISVGWDQVDGHGGLVFECGKTYRLRVDIKGSPALRFLSHNVYRVVDAFSGCCTDDCSATCTGATVDAACVLLQWKDQLNRTPLTNNFIQPHVYINDGGDPVEVFSALDVAEGRAMPGDEYVCNTETPGDVVAGLTIEAAYEDTKFGICTFTPTDHYELQPLKVFASIQDETGEPCAIKPIANTSTGDYVTELQAPRQAQGVGESVIRDLILAGRYRQEAFPDSSRVESLRMREIEGNPSLTGTAGQTIRTSLFNSINILHNVPRLNNPSGTFDNDQYLLTIYVPTGVDNTAFLNTLQTVLNCAGNGIEVENWTVGGVCADVNVTEGADGGCVTNV